ncbi:DJ-1/PfpI family protein [Paenibacillus sp. CC-CFT747]|nr:DJ-1/PfpI family protein [Paenibacillus sp. CC-CFT747]
MMRVLLRLTVYLLLVIIFVGGVGFYGFNRHKKDFYYNVRHEVVPSLQVVDKPPYNPHKPTVAVVLSDSSITTEDFDFLIPYTLLSMTDAYNVYAVAPDTSVKSLSGGLDVIPHYSYEGLDRLLNKSPDIIVVPYMPKINSPKYEPTRAWIQKQAGSTTTTFISICGGALNLADAGMLKGKAGTSHWQFIPILKKQYPDTQWEDNVRYVDDGHTISSAGQSAGIDAVLHLIERQLGEPMAARISNDIHYPSYPFVQHPEVDHPFHSDIKFATYWLNIGFHWDKKKVAVMLYNGMDEIALSSIFDSYGDTGTTQLLTVSNSNALITTKHHLQLLARNSISKVPRLDQMIIPGSDAQTQAAAEIKRWNGEGNSKKTLLIHSDAPNRYAFEAPLEDLAKQQDILTARHAVKRFEYRSTGIKLEGDLLPLATYKNLLITVLVALFIAFWIDRRFIMKKKMLARLYHPSAV